MTIFGWNQNKAETKTSDHDIDSSSDAQEKDYKLLVTEGQKKYLKSRNRVSRKIFILFGCGFLSGFVCFGAVVFIWHSIEIVTNEQKDRTLETKIGAITGERDVLTDLQSTPGSLSTSKKRPPPTLQPSTEQSPWCKDSDKYTEFQDKCYAFYDFKQSWYEASAFCRRLQGKLAEPRTLQVNNFIKGLIQNNSYHSVSTWIGGNYLHREGQWRWNYREEIAGFTDKWSPERVVKNGFNCLTISFRSVDNIGMWDDAYCGEPFPFVCETNGTLPPSTPNSPSASKERPSSTLKPTTKTSASCPATFIFHYDFKSWFDANATCNALGGILAEPRSLAEMNFLKQLIITGSGGQYYAAWLGGNDLKIEGRWEWSSGDAITGFTDWVPGQPDNQGGNEHCLLMGYGSLYTQLWVDTQCEWRNTFVCQTCLA